jgi:hypothetical protein
MPCHETAASYCLARRRDELFCAFGNDCGATAVWAGRVMRPFHLVVLLVAVLSCIALTAMLFLAL